MKSQHDFKKFFCCLTAILYVISASVVTNASDFSEWFWGGPGSRTTVNDPYIPPPLVTETAYVPASDTPAHATTQSNLMLGTPGAMTLPPSGVLAANGVAVSGASSASYVMPMQMTTAANIVPAVQMAPAQPIIDYEWTYSTIKDVTYEFVTVYDPRLGGFVTISQEKQTESVLPWLHRKQVVRYPSPAPDAVAGNGTGTPVPANNPDRYIVNRLFPVSTVPSPPAQAVPVQTIPQPATPITTYATETTVMRPVDEYPIIPAVTIATPITEYAPVTEPVPVMENVRAGVLSTNTSNPSGPTPMISSYIADTPPSLSGVVSPSEQIVLYPSPSENSMSLPLNRAPDIRPIGQQPSNVPTLAPLLSDQSPGDSMFSLQDPAVTQRPLIEDSLYTPESLQSVLVQPGAELPMPIQPSQATPPPVLPEETPVQTIPTDVPSTTPNTTKSGIPLLTPPTQTTTRVTVPSTARSTGSTGRNTSAVRTRSGLSVSPTQMPTRSR